ncbi:MAG: acetamidase/formamidase family protein [Chitinophagales bacterium]
MKMIFLILYSFISIVSDARQNQYPSTDTVKGIRIVFHPKSFSNSFSLNIDPVMTIRQGDTIETETIDAGGYDQQGVKRQRGGNPLTGPFYVDQAKAGDILAISLLKVSLNRDYAFTTEGFVDRSMPDSITKQFGKRPSLVRWTLDRRAGLAWPDTARKSYTHLRGFKIPLHPFLGCVGLAPATGKNEILSYFQGSFGGNLDFHLLGRGATLYLPVFHDGAYLYFGDGHAIQGSWRNCRKCIGNFDGYCFHR